MTAHARAFDSVGRKWLQSRGPPLAWGEVRREQKAMKSVRTREVGWGLEQGGFLRFREF